MNILTDDGEDLRLAYARKIEAGANANFGNELVPNSLAVAQTLWTIRNRRRANGDSKIVNLPDEYSEGWGYHVSPELFLTLAALCDRDQHLISKLTTSCSLTDLIACVDDHAILETDDLFEIGGSFLDTIVANSTTTRSHDAEFGKQGCLTVDSLAIGKSLQLIFASALFEETSGIIRTLIEGPASNKELQPVFQSLGYADKYYDRYRRALASIAAFELFAWSRNQLGTGGFLVVNNVLSPAAIPSEEQLAFLGFASHPELFPRQMSGPGGDYLSAVYVYQAGLKRDSSSSLSATIEDYPSGTGRWHKRLRQRKWSWLDEKIVARWV